MPTSTAGPVSRHRLALGRIPGLEMDDSIAIPGEPGRQFLASDKYCPGKPFEFRQSVNGAYLMQTVDWFLEFAPTDKQNEHHNKQFWTLVRDETGIDIERLTPSNVEKIYVAFQDMRILFRTRKRRKYPHPQEEDVTDEQMFFIDLLDATRFRFSNRISRFQLHYGLRRDDDFGERLATRVVQWRLRLQDPDDLLFELPQIGPDVLPVEQQDENFKYMAEKYALLFNKASSKTTDDVATDDDAKLYVDVSKDSPKTAMLKRIDLRLLNLQENFDAQKGISANIHMDLRNLGRGMLDKFRDLKMDLKNMGEGVRSVQTKEDGLATDRTKIKQKVSHHPRASNMDTRSVIRSRRQSTRLKSQPRDDKAEKQSMPNRRVLHTRVSTIKSAIPKSTTFSAKTIKKSQPTTKTPPTMTPKPIDTAKSSKNGKCVANTPVFPNLLSTKNTRLDTKDMESPVTGNYVKTEHTLATKKTISTTKESLIGGSTDKPILPVTTEPQDFPHRVLPLYSLNSSLTDLDELPPYGRLSVTDNPADEDDIAEKTSPIPELMAEIARIIETSSPIAAQVPTDQNSSFMQQRNTDPLLPTLTSGDAFHSGGVFRTSQHQRDGPRAIKRGAEELSPDEQTPALHQLSTSSRHFSVLDFPSTVNLIEAAASRDCYEIEDDDELDNSLWMDGQTGEAGRSSRNQEDLVSDEYVHLTGTYGSTQDVHFPPQPQQQTDSRRTTEQISTNGAERMPASSPQTAGSTSYLHDISKCAGCGKTPRKFLLCVRCLKTRYCGKYCQIWDWPFHRRMCDASETANPGEVTKQKEYLDEMWAGALRMLKENVNDTDHETDGSKENQPCLQSHAKYSFKGFGAGGNIVEQGMGLLGTAGEAVTWADGVGQQGGIYSVSEGLGGRVATDRQLRDDIHEEEGGVVFKMPPPSPKSMFQSRAMALRLAQVAEFRAK
ncbi:MYND-type zinc finger protein MUB1 [Cytospora mali]|uniref:MYND-type zinc finger protein MUB1 n=1 Tax=Cytospora mali TaxID=578113 RepID=A0A194VAP9_CYTMA|nr:MYND-type zinc finger protein MUB1 [Valsa mali var. pyri (nom. inval.)]